MSVGFGRLSILRAGGLAAAALAAAPACASISLELRPLFQTANVGDTVGVGLYAVADSPAPQNFSVVQAVIAWDHAHLELLGVNGIGGVAWGSSGFPSPDPYGLNESNPPGDGNGLWLALPLIGVPNTATAAGTLLTTFEFEASAETAAAHVAVLAAGGTPTIHTAVFDAVIPNFNILGGIGAPATIEIVPEPATAILLACLGMGWLRRR